jgi:hypothetical protein
MQTYMHMHTYRPTHRQLRDIASESESESESERNTHSHIHRHTAWKKEYGKFSNFFRFSPRDIARSDVQQRVSVYTAAIRAPPHVGSGDIIAQIAVTA